MEREITRRKFVKGSAVAAGTVIAAGPAILSAAGAGSKLNVAAIGVGGRGWSDLNGVSSENIVALCDVNSINLGRAAKKFPKAKTYVDWRRCLEQKDIDAVVCATTDHTHAFVVLWAMNRGKHVYCEKPVANSVEEARLVRQTYIKNRGKLATQHGTQIHASDNYRRVAEMIRGGAIGTPKSVRVWCSRMPKGGDYLPEQKPIPAHINWDLWVGPSPMHPYNRGYIGGCLKWNRYWDFGSGQIGDMGSHMMDLASCGFDLGIATSCQAEGSPRSDATVPTWLKATWEIPANNWRPAITAQWYDGGKKPSVPSKVFNRDGMFKGAIFEGTKGWIIADYSYRIMMMKGDMTHYTSPKPEDLIPKSIGHHREWIEACKTGKPTTCDFDYAGRFIENNMLALVAYRTGEKLQWDEKDIKAANSTQADKYIKKTYRQGWVLNG